MPAPTPDSTDSVLPATDAREPPDTTVNSVRASTLISLTAPFANVSVAESVQDVGTPTPVAAAGDEGDARRDTEQDRVLDTESGSVTFTAPPPWGVTIAHPGVDEMDTTSAEDDERDSAPTATLRLYNESLRDMVRLFAYCGATVTFSIDRALTSANVPSASAANANTCAVEPSAVSTCIKLALTLNTLVDDVIEDGAAATLAPVSTYARRAMIATIVSFTTRPFDTPAAEMMAEPFDTPVTTALETEATALLELTKEANDVTSAPAIVVKPTPPKSASSRKRAVSN